MENTHDSDQNSLIINELTQGKELLIQLKMHIDSSSSSIGQLLLTKLQSSFDKSIFMLNSYVEPQFTGPTTDSPRSMITGSPRSDSEFELGDKSKKRKTMPRWTKQFRVRAELGMEGPVDDGYSWRKYGQKDILGANHPRGYYRCSHRNIQGCLALKQVQRSDEDPSFFTVTYRGKHTCIQESDIKQAQTPKKQQDQNQKKRKPQETFLNFQTGLEVKTEDFYNQEFTSSSFSFPTFSPISRSSLQNETSILSSFKPNNKKFIGSSSSPSFVSTSTNSESNYFSPAHRMNNFTGQNIQTSDPDLNEIISGMTSASNSPILDLDLDFPIDFDLEFPFDSTPLFS